MSGCDLVIPAKIIERVHESVTATVASGAHCGWTVGVSGVEGVISYQYG